MKRPVQPPQRFKGPRHSAAGGAQIAAIRRNRRNAQIRNALLCAIGLGGLWIGVQKFGLLTKTVVVGGEPAVQAPKKKILPQTEESIGTTESEVGYKDLLDGAPRVAGRTKSAFGSSGGETEKGEQATAGSQEAAEPGAVGEVAAASNADIFSDTTLVLVGLEAGRDTNVQRDADLLATALREGAWDSYQKMLARSIDAAIPLLKGSTDNERTESFWKSPELYRALLRWKMLSRFSPNDLHGVAHDSRACDMITWVMNTPEKMEEMLLTVQPQDDTAKVMVFLKDAWTAKEDFAKKYFNLALACAVVFDKPMETVNPGGPKASSYEPTVDPLIRYLWYMDKNEKGKLVGSVDRMWARDLVYVVCAPVVASELEWAVTKMNLSRQNWGSAYGMIEYLMERAVKGVDPYEAYTFAEIQKEGGICGDQSYFCANTARANGIPAMIFSGETDLGGHAWVALKVKDDEWSTQIGRIGGVSKGQTDNPQVGGTTTEQEVWLITDRQHQSEGITLSVFRPLWLSDFHVAQDRKQAASGLVRLANGRGRSFLETWSRLYNILEDEAKAAGDPTNPEVFAAWKAFASDMRREFKDNPRMAALAAKAETEHIFPYSDDNATRTAFIRERRRTERDATEQMDLLAESLKRQAEALLKKDQATALTEISRLYDPALRNYGGSITGFKMIMADYFNFMKATPETGKKAVRDIELAFNRVVKTNSGNWFRTTTEAGIVSTIAGYYREVGDPERAKLLEKRYEREVYRAERSAL